MSRLHGYKYFTTIDLSNGFFHIPIRQCDREKTAFTDGENLYQFSKMPQGYKNSPSIFQRSMHLILEGLIGNACLVYIDDILVYGKNEEEHDINLQSVEKRLVEYGLVENFSKRVYKQTNVKFLGYCIGENTIKPETERAQAIISYKTPSTKKELQRFLGAINYDRIFLSGITEIASPLYKLLDKTAKFKWEDEHEKAFIKIKEFWENKLELIPPNFEEKFILESDASDVGLGAVLRQENGPVAYISRALKGSEKNYTITERETLAAVWSMEKFSYYLQGREFLLVTDHKALEELKQKKEFGTARIRRWFEKIEQFQFKVQYRPGKTIVQSDAFSRAVGSVEEGERSQTSVEKKVLQLHETLGHRKNLVKPLERIGVKIQKTMLRNILKNCIVCQEMDIKTGKNCKLIKVSRPGEIVGVDLLEISKRKRVVVMIDYFSRFVFAKLLRRKKAEQVLDVIKNVYEKFKFEKLIADNGREFKNSLCEEWCKQNSVVLEFSIPYYHASNGRVERVNKTLREMIKRTKGSLKTKLGKIVCVYNESYHRGVNMSPNDALNPENLNKVFEHQEKYATEFKRFKSKCESFNVGDAVLIKNEQRRTKMDKEFNKRGTVVKHLYGNVYEVKDSGGRTTLRHSSQLRGIGEGGCVWQE